MFISKYTTTEDLNAIELATAYAKLKTQFNLTTEEIAKRFPEFPSCLTFASKDCNVGNTQRNTNNSCSQKTDNDRAFNFNFVK